MIILTHIYIAIITGISLIAARSTFEQIVIVSVLVLIYFIVHFHFMITEKYDKVKVERRDEVLARKYRK